MGGAAHPVSGWSFRLRLPSGGAGLVKRIQDGVQLGTHGVGEFAVELPHAVAALFQLQTPPVLLQLVIKGFGSVRIGGIDHTVGVAAQLHWPQHGCIVGEQLLRSVHIFRVQPGAGEFVHGPFHNLYFLRCHHTGALQRRQPGQHRFQLVTEHRFPWSTAAAARTREAASPGESCSTCKNLVTVEEQ